MRFNTAGKQICVIHEARTVPKKSKDSLKDCFENVNITDRTITGPVHEILVIISYAHMPSINALAGISGGARGPKFGPSPHLYPYFVSIKEVKTFVSLCICTDSPELSLLDNAISEGLDWGAVWLSIFIKNLVHYSSR